MPTNEELREICRKMGLRGYSHATKPYLLSMIKNEIERVRNHGPPVRRTLQLPPIQSSLRDSDPRMERIQHLERKIGRHKERKERDEMGKAERRDIEHRRMVRIVKEAKKHEKDASIHVKGIGNKPISYFEKELRVKLEPADVKTLRWVLNKDMDARRKMYAEEYYNPERQFEFIMSNKERLVDVIEARRRLQFNKEIPVVEKYLDPYVIENLRDIIRGYLEPKH